MAYKYEYLSNQNMNLRPAPNVNNSPIGSIKAYTKGLGDELTIYPDGGKWLKVLSGGSTIGWVAVVPLGIAYGVVTEISQPAETIPPTPTELYPAQFSLTPLDSGSNPIGQAKIYIRQD